MVIIGRQINGISINGNEYILNDDGTMRTWENKDEACKFLMHIGETLQSIMDNYVIQAYGDDVF